jgi:hypothetical protein
VLRDAEAAGYHWDAETQALLDGPRAQGNPLAELEARAELLGKQRNEQRGELSALDSARGTARPERASSGRKRSLSRLQIAALDEIGPWLSDPTTTEQLGHALGGAVLENRMEVWGGLTIGGQGWAARLIERLGRMIEALKRVPSAAVSPAEPFLPSERFARIARAVAAHQAVRDRSAVIQQALNGKLGPCSNAINELVAVFTPARWAYPDIAIELGSDGDRSTVQLSSHGAEIGQRLNAAELTAISIALLLLLGVGLDAPLRTLVFDDPLQSMDELTVTAVARGVFRVMRLMPEPWQLLLFLHGEDDVERFRRELGCSVYELEWLSPSPSGARHEPIDANARKSLSDQDVMGSGHALQPLQRLLRARGVSKSA